eukprot:GEMP01033802.1.p1 GENE.GEMP01033802.1~~GEMP01033802.1.p1  ORF type:complete len:416 (-),score=108.27 GEMP01033802.1:362-1609(-)
MLNANAIYEDSFVVKTFAGSGKHGHRDGKRAEAEFNVPASLVVDRDNSVFVCDNWNYCVRKISAADGVVYTIAGTGSKGFRDGTKQDAQFVDPRSMALTSDGGLIVTDTSNHRIRAVSPNTRSIKTVAGCGERDLRDGPAGDAAFASPCGVALDADDNIIVSDSLNHCIRMISATHSWTWTIAGNGEPGYRDGVARRAQFSDPRGLAVNLAGDIFVADRDNHCIRRIEAGTRAVSTVAGTGQRGWRDGTAKVAEFDTPADVAVDMLGRIYVADSMNHCIRRIDPTKGEVITIAGVGNRGLIDGSGRTAEFCTPVGIDVTKDGVLHVADLENSVIRVVMEVNDERVMVSSRELHELREKLREKEDSRLCKVCYDRPRECSFSPCGHIVCCMQCAKRVDDCPVCCATIKKSQRVYEA